MKIYISGAITGTNDYLSKFAKAEGKLSDEGYEVINPARIMNTLPHLEYEDYMSISIVLLMMCDAIYMLDGWQESKGANREYGFALGSHRTIIEELEDEQ